MQLSTPFIALAASVSLALVFEVSAVAQSHEENTTMTEETPLEGYIDANPNAGIEMMKLPM